MAERGLLFGCVADDLTGAGDAASFLAGAGMETVLSNEVPEGFPQPMPQAVVIALKTRTAPVKKAVDQTLKAMRWLREAGAKQLYLKYCSTFDSTREGNIGPVADAILEAFQIPYTILCPALPVNQRVVRDGHLYVKGVPLHESSMRDHPLTPMWDDRIQVLMEAQSRYRTYLVSLEDMVAGKIPKPQEEHYYLIPDHYLEEHGRTICQRFGDLPLLTGGSGLMAPIAERLIAESGKTKKTIQVQPSTGGAIILAGSCSEATLGQIAHYQEQGGISFYIDPEKLLDGLQTEESLRHFLKEHAGEEVLFYSSASAKDRQKPSKYGQREKAARIEQTMASLAAWALEEGKSRVIVAGGETSGAVTKRLGYQSYVIGVSIAPGVPVMIPTEDTRIRLVFKSGNFGQEDFFVRAIHMTKGE